MVNKKDQAQESQSVEIPLLPLKDIVVFPHMIIPVFINEDLCINAVEQSLSTDRKIFLSAFKVAGTEGEGLECKLEPPFDVYDIGTICSIMRTRKLPDGRMKVLVQGLSKASVNKLLKVEDYPSILVDKLTEPVVSSSQSEVEAMLRAVRENLEKVVSLGKILSPDILMVLEDIRDPGRLSDLVAANLGLKVDEAQKILSVSDPISRLQKVHTFLSREIEVYQMQVKIQSQAKEEIGKVQREHYLREQIRALKSELGDYDPKEDFEQLWKQVKSVKLSDEAREEVSRQLRRLERMHQDTSEASLTRNHIEIILQLPWETYSEDRLDLQKVQDVLDDDHFGLGQVKDRIIEHLAVKKLNPNSKSPIICFAGPPGVGKTSLGKSIAKSMGRSFSRISLGGVRDEADIRGHRKTYVGAYPGRIISSLKKASTSNPVIMLDEIDKLGSDHRGDPSAALLEVLDLEQNSSFTDHYLGIPFDLSKIMFIANANNLDSIPAPLKDRLEIIEISGYSADEKFEIANKFLIPKQLEDTGLNPSKVQFKNGAISCLIDGYTRESGLRNLEKQIASVCRKVARTYAESKEDKVTKITHSQVVKLLGPKKYEHDFYHSQAVAGVSLGMAYTQFGGEILAFETNLLPGKGRLVLTGLLGDVMKESAQAAYSYIRSKASDFGIDLKMLQDHEIHIHVPQGAIPKDGPSAGVAIATSILSALLKTPPLKSSCMTGEITILGKVLPIGGLKEKILAAQREKLEVVIIPEKNRAVFHALPSNIKRKLKFHFVSDYHEVFEILFEESFKSSNLSPNSITAGRVQDIAS